MQFSLITILALVGFSTAFYGPAYHNRRQAPATPPKPTQSLCVNVANVNGCVGPNGKANGNLPQVTSAMSVLAPAASAIGSVAAKGSGMTTSSFKA